jgi:general secretion pathway protein H
MTKKSSVQKMNQGGFTLLEIIVVLAIVAMLLVVVVPRLPSSDSENLKISARTLASTLRYIQDRSATSRSTYFMVIEPGTDVIRLLEASADGSDKNPDDPLLRQRPIKEGIMISDVMIPRLGKVNEGQLRLTIGMGGLRDFTVFHLQSKDNSYWTVMAFPSSGKVKIYEGYLETPL